METERFASDIWEKGNKVETEEMLDSLFEHFPGCVMRIRFTNGIPAIEYISSSFEKVTTRTEEEIREYFKKFENASPEEKVMAPGKELEQAALLYGKGERREYSIPGADGKKHWLEVRSSVISRTEDSVLLQTVFFDITDQKLTEQQMKKDQNFLPSKATTPRLRTDFISLWNSAQQVSAE